MFFLDELGTLYQDEGNVGIDPNDEEAAEFMDYANSVLLNGAAEGDGMSSDVFLLSQFTPRLTCSAPC
tara:strand:- start:699 stop:902 length:204 start_codon:yes stop_codon:yes gene_type:complete